MSAKCNLEPATKQDVQALKKDVAVFKKEILDHFDLRFELLRDELLGAENDKYGNHELRISRLEQAAGLNLT